MVGYSIERVTRNGSVVVVEEDEYVDDDTLKKIALIDRLKKDVKLIMEEAVTKKVVDLECPYVTELCGTYTRITLQ